MPAGICPCHLFKLVLPVLWCRRSDFSAQTCDACPHRVAYMQCNRCGSAKNQQTCDGKAQMQESMEGRNIKRKEDRVEKGKKIRWI